MSNVPESCRVPHHDGWYVRNNNIASYEYYALMGKAAIDEIINSGLRPASCGDCVLCVPKVSKGTSFGQSALVVLPNNG
ncbi:MAG: hypothetical protein UU93_C0007G0009 [Candidatus Amesbacteria bacterium GW2011_GWA2_42_12]|uniref:Uncharacterized protein n=1 Tax=Candidatus Amesbacteria bacterium GW2011_GWA2_42_12 TaxID=1618356 RepID=A0A0G0Y6P6_9BACT|nr:MAG: hypothetical protein UU93_C0007G0009 [Candidatus Amesbacteria bacterium GW2011_GWA2_42_12]